MTLEMKLVVFKEKSNKYLEAKENKYFFHNFFFKTIKSLAFHFSESINIRRNLKFFSI